MTTTAVDSRPTVAEIDEALAEVTVTIRRLRLTGTHAELARAERYLDHLLDQRSR
jgi:hypothetical protein